MNDNEQIFNIPDFKTLLKKQGYRSAGNHSAVKTCLWLGRSVKGEGSCYKSKFYGINSHQCMQMTPTMMCNQKCLHCWRPVEVDVRPPERWDSPVEIVGSTIESHKKLISGFGDSGKRELWMQANQPKHAAISLAGEPTLYPYLPELVDEFSRNGITTFVVTNGTNPEMVERINPTQLYMSLDAPDRETYNSVCSPRSSDYWENINRSLEILGKKAERTAVRVTLIKGENMFNPSEYARLLEIANPDFVELKAYMHLGFSRRRLPRDAMPSHDEVLSFAHKIAHEMGYKIADDVETSRVVLLSKTELESYLF